MRSETVRSRVRDVFLLRFWSGKIPDIGKHMEQYFNSPEWKTKMERLQQLPDCTEMQQRMRQLESKMKDLEKRLQK